MKQLLNIFLILTVLSCKAQSIIVPLGSSEDLEYNQNYYEKDVNNELNKFEGNWKYQNGTTVITIKLKKETHYLSPSNYYTDMLIGEYQYIENGVEKANTLSDFDNPLISGYDHKISGGIFTHRLPNHCIDNSDIAEIKIEVFINHPVQQYTEGRVILRYLNDNGVKKIQACIYDNTTLGNIPNAKIPIPNGYYEFVKQ